MTCTIHDGHERLVGRLYVHYVENPLWLTGRRDLSEWADGCTRSVLVDDSLDTGYSSRFFPLLRPRFRIII